MATLNIILDAQSPQFLPGDAVSCVASWALDAPAEWLEVRLFWFTSGKGTRDVGVVDTQRVMSPPLRGERRLEMTLPDSPYSFSGKYVSLRWALELVPAGEKEAATCELTMSPTGDEINLYARGEVPQDKGFMTVQRH